MKTIRTFNNVRSLVYRLSNGTQCEGWAIHLGQNEARIRLTNFALLNVGETVEGECYGDGTLVRFTGRITGQAGQEIAIAVAGSMSFEPSRDEVRLQVDNMVGLVGDGAREATLIVLDVSPTRLHGLVDFMFPPLSILRLSLPLPNGRFEAAVKLVSCRADAVEPGHYRVELQIAEASRLDTATWQHLLEERAGS